MKPTNNTPSRLRKCQPIVNVYETYGSVLYSVNDFRDAVKALEAFLLFYGIRMSASSSEPFEDPYIFEDLRTGKRFGEGGMFYGIEELLFIRPELFE